MKKSVFYDAIRKTLFGQITADQVQGMEVIIDEYLRRGLDDLRWLAYILSTAYHETAHTFQPIEEYGKGNGRKYGVPDPTTGKTYYGRGYVQLTWLRNYQLFADRYGVDFVNQPELALVPEHAVKILFDGMINGLYSGVGLPRYFGKSTDWVGARAIVNGTDKAQMLATYAKQFYQALQAAADFNADEAVEVTSVTTAAGEELTTYERESPPIVHDNAPAPVADLMAVSEPWHSGWKTHVGMFISGVIGIAAMLGQIPGMTPDQGASMLQSAMGVSGVRSAAPTLIKMAINYYLKVKM